MRSSRPPRTRATTPTTTRRSPRSDPSRFVDPVVSAVYEPGSVFKMLTATAALRPGVVTPHDDAQRPGGPLARQRRASVQNADKGSKGAISFEDVVAWSRNVVMSQVALMLARHDAAGRRGPVQDVDARWASAPRRASTWRARCPASSATRRSSRGSRSTSPTRSFGQGVAVTLIQLATAYSAMVNGGILPHAARREGRSATTPTPGDRPRPRDDACAGGRPSPRSWSGWSTSCRSTGPER